MRDETGAWIHEKGLWPLEEALRLAGMTVDDLKEWIPGEYGLNGADGMIVQLKDGRAVSAGYYATPEEIAAALTAPDNQV